ncbi:MAG: tRNA lysidine(34) synthetase TilS [Thermodesulfobacteriota bacterium]
MLGDFVLGHGIVQFDAYLSLLFPVKILRSISEHMEDLIRQSIEGSSLISPGDRVLVAISGGADSTALLYALSRLGAQMGFSVAAAHLNHGIRHAATHDALQVARLCRDLGVTCVFGVEDVPMYASTKKKGLEEAGRELRYSFLREAARMSGCNRIATAHHQQDQAETLMMRLARGTSVSGLKGIPERNLPFIRPLLMSNRRQVEAYLQHHDLIWAEDESNSDCRFTRNHVRHNLMPVLEAVHPQAQKHVAQLAHQACVEEEYWANEVDKVLKKARFETGEIRILYSDLATLHPALRMRVVRAILESLRSNLHGLERKHLQVVESIFAYSRPQVQFDLPGVWVARRYADMVFRREAPRDEMPDYCLSLEGPGVYRLPDGSGVEVMLRNAVNGESTYCVEFDSSAVEWPLFVRKNRAGDRLKCVGMTGSKKLKALFAERKLESEQRKSVPLLCSREDEILWVVGVRRSRLWCCSSSTHRVVRVVFTPPCPKL